MVRLKFDLALIFELVVWFYLMCLATSIALRDQHIFVMGSPSVNCMLLVLLTVQNLWWVYGLIAWGKHLDPSGPYVKVCIELHRFWGLVIIQGLTLTLLLWVGWRWDNLIVNDDLINNGSDLFRGSLPDESSVYLVFYIGSSNIVLRFAFFNGVAICT